MYMNGPLPKRENSIIEVTLFDSNQLGVWKKNQLKKSTKENSISSRLNMLNELKMNQTEVEK